MLDGTLLRRTGDLPKAAGVYAFAIGDRVMYVGVASRNLVQRLGFYGRPAATQSTNIRLRALICEASENAPVRILHATPPVFDWNGLRVDGATGLEAGLIATYDLPWNKKGGFAFARSRSPLHEDIPIVATSPSARATLRERVEAEIIRSPRSTEAEIAHALFGRAGYQQKVNPICRFLLEQGRVRRLGTGGRADPYVYVALV